MPHKRKDLPLHHSKVSVVLDSPRNGVNNWILHLGERNSIIPHHPLPHGYTLLLISITTFLVHVYGTIIMTYIERYACTRIFNLHLSS